MTRNAPKFDLLQQFAAWWMNNNAGIPPSPPDAVHRCGPVTVLTLYRDETFQVQLALCDPYSEITDHKHPGVELIKVYVSGEIYLRVNGQPVITAELLAENGGNMNGRMMRIGENDSHGALIGPKGGAFITIQHHLRAPAKPLQLCWAGSPLDARHRKALVEDGQEQFGEDREAPRRSAPDPAAHP